MSNLEAVCAHRQFSSLKGMSLNLADKNFFQAVPQKPLITKKKGGGATSSPYLFLIHTAPSASWEQTDLKASPQPFIVVALAPPN